jgi:F0F1-type ATP synthase membrane subunit c/vacuolar-type H+-ATPase subunit K
LFLPTVATNVAVFFGAQLAAAVLGVNEAMASPEAAAAYCRGRRDQHVGMGLAFIGIALPTAFSTIAAAIAVGPIGAASLAAVSEKAGDLRTHPGLPRTRRRYRHLRPGAVHPVAQPGLRRMVATRQLFLGEANLATGFSLAGFEVFPMPTAPNSMHCSNELIAERTHAFVVIDQALASRQQTPAPGARARADASC